MNAQLKTLINSRNDLWCANNKASSEGIHTINTSHKALNQALLNGGWPLSVTTEILCDQQGIGEITMLMPTLAKLSQQEKWIALIAPPHIPYAPALDQAGIDSSRILMIHPRNEKELLWATEQALKTGTCSAVISWFGTRDIKHKDLLRLQQAAKQSDCLHIQFRSSEYAMQPSPAHLRITLSPSDNSIEVGIVKQRGTSSGYVIPIDRPELLTKPQPNLLELRPPKKSSYEHRVTNTNAHKSEQTVTWQ